VKLSQNSSRFQGFLFQPQRVNDRERGLRQQEKPPKTHEIGSKIEFAVLSLVKNPTFHLSLPAGVVDLQPPPASRNPETCC
jgi:hypothetical protein